ncbi:nucleoside triphosphate pyrophosphohydrolase [Candidatus Nitrospira bockiana]
MSQGFDELVELMARLRAPNGCPWDRKQTHESLKPYLIEETYEVLEAIDHDDPARLREELGDLLLQVLFHAQIRREAGQFGIEDVIAGLTEKLVRRHPHVFGTEGDAQGVRTPEDVKVRWEEIKKSERQEKGEPHSALDGVPKTLPALLRASQVQARASRVGFDWKDLSPVLGKLEEELAEFREALAAGADAPDTGDGARRERAEAELGDLLFTLVNVARFLKINPEEALRKTINRFTERFHYVEGQAAASGRPLERLSLDEMDILWEQAKAAGPGGDPR